MRLCAQRKSWKQTEWIESTELRTNEGSHATFLNLYIDGFVFNNFKQKTLWLLMADSPLE